MARRWRRIPPEKRRQIIKLAATGATCQEIADKLDLWPNSVDIVLRPLGGVIRREMWDQGSRRLSLQERIDIRLGLEQRLSLRCIARNLQRNPATVCREVNANGGRHAYRPSARTGGLRPMPGDPSPPSSLHHPSCAPGSLPTQKQLWSPQQIAARLAEEFGDDHTMRISHETIYKSLYVQGRGELRRELARCLRTGRAKRVHRGRIERRGQIADMVMISERPPEVDDRAVPGHWEGDLIMGRNGRSAIGTLAERAFSDRSHSDLNSFGTWRHDGDLGRARSRLERCPALQRPQFRTIGAPGAVARTAALIHLRIDL